MAGYYRFRQRVSDGRSYGYDHFTDILRYADGNIVITNDPRIVDYTPKIEVMNDLVTSNYYEILRSKLLLPFNPMDRIVHVVGPPKATFARHVYSGVKRWNNWTQQAYWHSGNSKYSYLAVAPPSNAPMNFEGSKKACDDAATNACLAALNGPIAQSLVTVSELGKTISLVFGAKKRFFKMFRDVFLTRKRRGKKVKKRFFDKNVLDHSADAYMEGRYGWRPLVGEIDSFIDAATRNLKPGFRMISRSRGFRRRETVEKGTIKIGECRYSVKTISNFKYRAKFTIGYRLNLEAIIEMTKRFGFTNWKLAIWENIPLSFVVDMFFNIGSTIGAFESSPGIELTQSGITSVMEVTTYNVYTLEYRPAKVTQDWYVGGSLWGCPSMFKGPTSKSVYYDRAQAPAEVKLPSFSMDLDVLQWLDIGVLAKTMLSQKR